MKSANAIDTARVELLLAELRLPAVKLVWAEIAGWPRNLARVSASRKVQIVLASGTVSASASPRKRTNDSRSRIRYSVRSSDRLWLA